MDSVELATVQVVPRAAGGVCGAHVDVAILSHSKGQVGVRPMAAGPADRAPIVLTLCNALHVLRYTGT